MDNMATAMAPAPAAASANRSLKRGFNRLFLVLTVAWLLWWSVGYPLRENGDRLSMAAEIRTQSENNCRDAHPSGAERDSCLASAQMDYQHTVGDTSPKIVYGWVWSIILMMGLGVPVLVYATARGVGAVCMWVWRGYKGV